MLDRARISLAIAILALAAVIGSVAVVGASSDEGASSEAPRTLSVNGDGAASAAPDIADIELGVETIDADPTVAIDDNTTAMDSVIEALTDLDIDEDDIQTRSFNMWVEQIYDEDGPTGEFRYHVVNQIAVRVRDIDMTGDVLGAALAAGANNVRGISFGVEDHAGAGRGGARRCRRQRRCQGRAAGGAPGSQGRQPAAHRRDLEGLPAGGPR